MRLGEGIAIYVERRRANGALFDKANSNLLSFQRQVGDVSFERISTLDILKYLDGPLTSTVTWRGKHSLLRHFFEFWLSHGATCIPLMPPPRPPVRQTFTPYIYTRSEIRRLLKSVRACQQYEACSVDAQTLRALLITLYATGAMVGELLRLTRKDVDLKRGLLTFQAGRFGRKRSIPIGPDLHEILKRQLANRLRADKDYVFVFAKKDGQPIVHRTLAFIFKRLREHAGVLRYGGSVYQPRLHDLRATFAVHRITSWIRNGAALNRMLPALAVYMGHAGLTAGDRYLYLTPERFRKDLDKLSPRRAGKRWRDDADLMKFLAHL